MTKKYPWWDPVIGEKEKELVLKCLDDNYPNEGNLSTKFENYISDLFGSKYAVAVTSGTSALYLSLKALNIGYGDEVILPDLTFIATANAIDMCGATPIFVDIDPKTLNINPIEIEKAISSKTKAIIPVHVTGRPADMENIIYIAQKYELNIVEDAAEAFMSKYNGKYLGTFGDTGCFSFSPNKIITTGQGGIIITDDEEIHLCLRELKDQGRPVRGTGGDDIHNSRGYNFKFTNVQAALGLGQLSYLNDRITRLIRTHKIYLEKLQNIDGLQVLPFNVNDGELPLWTDVIVEQRDEMVDYLKKDNIDCRKFWYPLHTQVPYKSFNKKIPISANFSRKAVWLPSAYTLSDDDVLFISDKINQFFNIK